MKNFLPQTLLQVLACLLFVVLIAVAVPFGIIGYKLNNEVTDTKIKNLLNSAQNIGDSATLNANAYGMVADTTTDLMKRNIGPAVDRIAARVDSTMIHVEQKVDLLEPLLFQLTQATAQSGNLIANTDARVNGDKGLLPVATAAIDSVRVVTETELRAAVAEFAQAGKNIRVITDAPELQGLPAEIATLTQSVNRSASKVEVILESTEATSAGVATVTGNLAKISDDSAKKVHSLLNPAPAPWYKRYVLYPLKDAAGVTYLLVKIANGL